MSMDEKLDMRNRTKANIALGGGAEKQNKVKSSGKMLAGERVTALFDEGSFIELDAFVSARNNFTAADGVVTGYGTVDGRLTFAYAQDPTVIGGCIGEMNAKKICKVYDMASKMGAPVVGILDSNGARLEEGVLAQAAVGEIMSCVARVSGIVPNISVVLGTCAGSSAIIAEMSDFVIMSEKEGAELFVNSPSVVTASTNKKYEANAKANAFVSGNIHFTGKDDAMCLEVCKLLLSYLPSNNLCDAPEFDCSDDLNRVCEPFVDVDGEYDVRSLIANIADDGAFMESQANYAKGAVTGFIRLNGTTVGVVANQGNEEGAQLSGQAIEKMARFVRFCDSFNIGILTFTDVEGFKVSADEENWGLARKSARLLYAFTEATVPKVNVIVKKAYGGAYVAMNSKQTGADIVLAYPTALIAAIAPLAGVGVLYSERLHAGESRDALVEEYKDTVASPYNAAKMGFVDDIIIPSETRPRVIAAFEMLRSKRVNAPSRKHDNMPL
ncbi:MAG: acyl-CoA carboxylase subunit beta [Clostridia bacterium]